MKGWIIKIIYTTLIFGIGIAGGYLLFSQFHNDPTCPDECDFKLYNGVYFGGWNITKAIEYSAKTDPYGDWIFVNVRKLNASESLDTCKHEVGHHIFNEMYAKVCEKNFTKCVNFFENEK